MVYFGNKSDHNLLAEKNDWFILIGLILLSLVPVFAGLARLIQIVQGSVPLEDVRFLRSPTPAVLHIVSASIYSVLGIFQFLPSIRKQRSPWHSRLGKLLIPLGLLSAFTGLWMTQFYSTIKYDGYILYLIRLAVGTSMIVFISLGLIAVYKRNFTRHGTWMIRAYALGMGAGTQVLTHLPWFLFPNIHGELARTVFMGSGWLINIVYAEWIIKKQLTKENI